MILDVTGREVKPGSFILFIDQHCYSSSLHPAMVLKINKKSLRVSISGHEKPSKSYGKEPTGIAKRIPLHSSSLYVIDDVPNVRGEFKKEVANIVEYCLENEKLSDEVRENCLFLMGALS